MDTIANLKEQVVAETPLLLFEASLANGQVERWGTHQVTARDFYGGLRFEGPHWTDWTLEEIYERPGSFKRPYLEGDDAQ